MFSQRNKRLALAIVAASAISCGAASADDTTTTPATTASPAAVDVSTEQGFVQNADPKWSKLINDGQQLLTDQKASAALSLLKRAVTQVDRSEAADDAAKDRMRAISNKKLGQAYALKGDFVKADATLKTAKAGYDKLSIKDDDLQKAMDDLAKSYKTIEVNSLGDSVTGYLKEAGVSQISVTKKDDGDLVEINLAEKYIKPIESKDVPKVSFAKKVSFQFFSKPNGDYQVSKIQGLQVLAKSLWVNLFESLLKVGAQPVAEVTAGKMGVVKTVTVNVPQEMYNSTKQILDNLVSAIKGQPAYAATTPDATPATPGATAGSETSSEASSETPSSPPSQPDTTPTSN